MSAISERFASLAQSHEGALACYLMGGDPDLDFSRQAVLTAAEAGADIIEVGIPFSEPIGDGPTIQAAGTRALAGGATPEGVLRMISQIRRNCDVPIVVMTYYNIALRPGLRVFARRLADSGVAGVILPDLPVPEASEWIEQARETGLDTIFLVSPSSTAESIREIAAAAAGFVYCVSLMGVTGARNFLASGIADVVGKIRAHTSLPVLIGFGVSRPEHVRDACQIADGAVVGSALIDLAARHYDNRAAALKAVSKFITRLKLATKRVQPAGAGRPGQSPEVREE